MSDDNKGRQGGWKIGGLVGMERVYKTVLFEQKVSKNILDREQIQKLWSGSLTVMFQNSKEVTIAKAEVGKGEHFRREYQRSNGRWRELKWISQKALEVTMRT